MITFVGQGPNQTAWVAALARFHARGFSDSECFERAELHCARIAVTGKLGEKLAQMIGVHPLRLYSRCARINLNARWNGKNGKGDAFDAVAGKASAEKLLSGEAGRFVLLGRAVAGCFDLNNAEFCATEKIGAHRFLVLPHPSGINAWYNESKNTKRAAKALRKFVELKP